MTTNSTPARRRGRRTRIARFTGALFGLVADLADDAGPALRAGAAVLARRSDRLGRLVHAVVRRQGAFRRLQAALVRRGISLPPTRPDGPGRRRGGGRLAGLLIVGLGTRYAALGLLVMTGDHPAHRSRRVGEFPPLLGVAGAGDHDLRAGQDRARLRAGAGPGFAAELTLGRARAFGRRGRRRARPSAPRRAHFPGNAARISSVERMRARRGRIFSIENLCIASPTLLTASSATRTE